MTKFGIKVRWFSGFGNRFAQTEADSAKRQNPR